MHPKIRDLTGEIFGKLQVLEYVGTRKNRNAWWRVRCECGNEKETPGYALVNGDTTSCGCARRKHGHTIGGMSKEYMAWVNMKSRCENKGDPQYHLYGARGIRVHQPWLDSFETFLRDVGHAPSSNLTLDRENNNGNYEPGNVRWASGAQQQRNKRNARKLEFKGKQYHIDELIAEIGVVDRETVRSRLRIGWTVEAALTTPKMAARFPRT